MKIPFQPVETSFFWIYLWNLVGVRLDFQPVVCSLLEQGTRVHKTAGDRDNNCTAGTTAEGQKLLPFCRSTSLAINLVS